MQALLSVLPVAFFLLLPLRLLRGRGPLFGLRIVCLVSWKDLKLGLFALFLLEFFDRPNFYRLVTPVTLLVKFTAGGGLYLGLSLGSG